MRSFRLRIALLAAGLAGTALIGFAAIAWQSIYLAKVNRLDAELENQLRRAVRPRLLQRWAAFESNLPRELGIAEDTPIALLVLGDRGIEYQSLQWSPEFEVDIGFSSRLRRLLPLPPSTGAAPEERRSRPERLLNRGLVAPPVQLETQRTGSGSWRLGSVRLPNRQVAIAVSLRAIDQEMGAILNVFLVTIPGTLLLVAVGAWGISGRALLPIRQLTSTMQRVTVSGLDQRIGGDRLDIEFVELIQVFNQMLARLERSFKQASRFSADAAHELKTPLAILQGEIERTLQQVETESEIQQNLSTLLDEVRRLSGIVRKLLFLSLADAGQMNFHKTSLNFSEMLLLIVEDMELLAPELSIKTEISPDLQLWGDRDLITQILQNLISNAIKYNLPQGWIAIQASTLPNRVQVQISNASQDIPEAERDRLFDRFYRGDPARTRKVEGLGLGLSLSREIARAHGGDLTVETHTTGQTTFVLTLPVGGGDRSPT